MLENMVGENTPLVENTMCKGYRAGKNLVSLKNQEIPVTRGAE